jgi:hypothetical protein
LVVGWKILKVERNTIIKHIAFASHLIRKRNLGKDSLLLFGFLVANLGGEWAQELVFLLEGLETTVTKFGRSIDELNFDLLGHPVTSGWEN